MLSGKNNDLPWSDPAGGAVSGHVDVYAHRGSMVLAPENTAVAFDIALSFGADVLEIDVRLSRDDQVIVCLLYTSPSPRDLSTSRMPSSA